MYSQLRLHPIRIDIEACLSFSFSTIKDIFGAVMHIAQECSGRSKLCNLITKFCFLEGDSPVLHSRVLWQQFAYSAPSGGSVIVPELMKSTKQKRRPFASTTIFNSVLHRTHCEWMNTSPTYFCNTDRGLQYKYVRIERLSNKI